MYVMAQKLIVELVDDLDGSASGDVSTVTFALDGAHYEIDLNEVNAERLRDGLADFVEAARKTGGRVKRATLATSPTLRPADRERTQAIREWARRNGHDIADRGRIPANVRSAFEEAQAAPSKRGRSKPKASAV